MALRPIVKLPHSVLGRAAKEVPPEEIKSAKIQRLILDMKATLAAAPDGVGLAAPQVGESLKIFLVSEEAKSIDTNIRMSAGDADAEKKKEWEYFVFINPQLVKKSQKKAEMTEGCLSVPGKFGLVPRSEKVMLSWLDESGKKHSRGFAGFFSRVIQHELDHLDGVLIADRAKRLFKAVDDKR